MLKRILFSVQNGTVTQATELRYSPEWVEESFVLGSSLSSGAVRWCPRICHESPEDGVGDAPLEASQSLLTRFTLIYLLAVVGSPLILRPGLAGGDHMQGIVELAVAGHREPVAHHIAARCLQRRRARVGGEVCLAREALHAADRTHDPRGQD